MVEQLRTVDEGAEKETIYKRWLESEQAIETNKLLGDSPVTPDEYWNSLVPLFHPGPGGEDLTEKFNPADLAKRINTSRSYNKK